MLMWTKIVQHLGRHMRGFIGVIDAFTIKWIDTACSITDHDMRWSNFWSDRSTHRNFSTSRFTIGFGWIYFPAICDHVRVRIK